MKKLLIKLALFLFIGNSSLYAVAGLSTSVCSSATKGFSSAVTVFTNVFMSAYNILPIKIAGVSVTPNFSLEDYGTTSMPICICTTPFPRVGIPIELWEPQAIIDVSNIPNCSPTLGMALSIDVVAGSSFQEINKQNTQNKESYQVTYIKYPIFKMLSLFLDILCLEEDGSVDVAYLTTVDPLWQNDMWSLIINPDAFLFANPVAQFACIPDAVASNMGFPIDPLYWCFGSWNQTFPLTKATTGVTSPESAMAIASKTLFKLHRQLMLWGTVGLPALCGKYPMPIMRKSQYMMYPVYPLMPHPFRIPIGRSALIWGAGQDVPVINSHVWSIMVYKKRSCCVL